MEREKYLPIGSVVQLKNAKAKMMITGYIAKGKETGDKIYDYIGCIYPLGVLTSEQTFLFNHENIEKIFYVGYEGEEWKEFAPELKQLAEKPNQEAESNNTEIPNNEETLPIDTNIENPSN